MNSFRIHLFFDLLKKPRPDNAARSKYISFHGLLFLSMAFHYTIFFSLYDILHCLLWHDLPFQSLFDLAEA